MRPLFCGNIDYETRQSDLERAFSKYGRVDRVDMKSGPWLTFMVAHPWVRLEYNDVAKVIHGLVGGQLRATLPLYVPTSVQNLPSCNFTLLQAHQTHTHNCHPTLISSDNSIVHHSMLFRVGISQSEESVSMPSLRVGCIAEAAFSCLSGFAFVYFDDERDAEDAIRGLDGISFGYNRRRLSVEWARQGERGRHREGSGRTGVNTRPTKTLFVINFDPIQTRIRDIERHFDPYGKLLHVRIRRNFAFVQFETQEDATKALEETNGSKMLDRVISVEYALRDDSERGDERGSPRRAGGYGRRDSPTYGRSPSPPHRRRPSPDYGNGRGRSPVYDRYHIPVHDKNGSPEYGRYRSRSPIRRSRT